MEIRINFANTIAADNPANAVLMLKGYVDGSQNLDLTDFFTGVGSGIDFIRTDATTVNENSIGAGGAATSGADRDWES